MADPSAPLLTHIEDEGTSPSSSFDKIFEQSLSGFSFPQFLQIIIVGLALSFDSQQIFITVFTDAYQTWHCLDHTICNPSTTDICELPRSAWEWDGGFKGKSAISAISEFELECSSSFLRGLPTSSFYMGSIVSGVFMALIPDSFLGRKKLFFLSTLAMSLTGISIFFSTSIWTYAFFKLIIGFARSQTGTYAINLISERVSTKWRPRATMIPFTLFVLGFMSLSGIAYLVRHASWRVLYLCTSVPAAIHSIFIYFFALESPRWLHVQGKNEEAIEVLKRLSPASRGYLESVSSRLHSKEQPPSSSIKDLFIRKWAFRRILVVMTVMFGLGMMYYGVPLAVRDIDVNIYLSEALNAAVELPTFVIAPILLEKLNRRSSVLANCLVGGALAVFCFVLTLLGLTNIAFVFELGSFFCARIGFNLMAVYMIEMYPTSVRNFATTMLRLSLVLGGAACPIIASVGRNVPSLSFAVFGFTVLGLGLFTLFLPETKGASLCDTMEAQEQREQAMETSSNSC